MTDALTTDLSKISALRVISRTSAMRYKGTNKSLPEIAKELNVDGIVEGSVMRSGNRVRITAQLIRATTDRHVWADSYEHDLGDVLKLQGEVAQAIAQQVRVHLTPQQQARLGSARAVNPEAYEAYLKGRFYATTGSSTLLGTKNAQRYSTRTYSYKRRTVLTNSRHSECSGRFCTSKSTREQSAVPRWSTKRL